MTDSALEPLPEHFAGSGPLTVARRYFAATRPKFFTASVLPVMVGFAWGYRQGGDTDILVVLLAVLATAVVHAASNVYNDVGDDINGTDSVNKDLVHPFTGGSRFIQNGILSREQMFNFSLALLLVSLLLGGALIALKGLTVLWLGLAGIALGILYSMPSVSLMSRGAGEIAIAISFGVLPVSGAAWLSTGRFDPTALWISLSVGLWVAAILQINQVPDMRADAAVGKRNLAVRLGVRGAAIAYLVMQLSGATILSILAIRTEIPLLVLPGTLLLALLACKATLGIEAPPSRNLAKSIKITLAIQLLGSICLCVSLVFAH